MDPYCSSPLRVIRNDLTSQAIPHKIDNCLASTSYAPVDSYAPDLEKCKENVNSINLNIDSEKNNKYTKVDPSHYLSNLDSLNKLSKDGSKNKNKKNEFLNNGSRRYSDSSAQKNSLAAQGSVAGSRFTTTLVAEDLLRPGTSTDNKSNNNVPSASPSEPAAQSAPSVTKANNAAVKPGFSVSDE